MSFAHMSPEKRREIAAMGGKAAHAKGKAHKFTSDEAREAGRKGGLIVSQDREYMRKIAVRGGAVSAEFWSMVREDKMQGELAKNTMDVKSEEKANG